MANQPDKLNQLMVQLCRAMIADLGTLLRSLGAPLKGIGSMTAGGNPYRVLGLDPSASDELVKLAYKLLSHKLHPDHGGSTEAMARLNRAYQEIYRMRGWK